MVTLPLVPNVGSRAPLELRRTSRKSFPSPVPARRQDLSVTLELDRSGAPRASQGEARPVHAEGGVQLAGVQEPAGLEALGLGAEGPSRFPVRLSVCRERSGHGECSFRGSRLKKPRRRSSVHGESVGAAPLFRAAVRNDDASAYFDSFPVFGVRLDSSEKQARAPRRGVTPRRGASAVCHAIPRPASAGSWRTIRGPVHLSSPRVGQRQDEPRKTRAGPLGPRMHFSAARMASSQWPLRYSARPRASQRPVLRLELDGSSGEPELRRKSLPASPIRADAGSGPRAPRPRPADASGRGRRSRHRHVSSSVTLCSYSFDQSLAQCSQARPSPFARFQRAIARMKQLSWSAFFSMVSIQPFQSPTRYRAQARDCQPPAIRLAPPPPGEPIAEPVQGRGVAWGPWSTDRRPRRSDRVVRRGSACRIIVLA